MATRLGDASALPASEWVNFDRAGVPTQHSDETGEVFDRMKTGSTVQVGLATCAVCVHFSLCAHF